MSLIRFGRGREYQFFRREDLRTRWDLKSATQFLNGFRQDTVAMNGLRREALKTASGPNSGNLSDEQVVQIIARQLVAGELLLAMPHRIIQKDHLVPEVITAAPVQPTETREEEEEEENTFDGDHDGVAQAATLIAAAKAAYPFCEECQKKMVEQGSHA